MVIAAAGAAHAAALGQELLIVYCCILRSIIYPCTDEPPYWYIICTVIVRDVKEQLWVGAFVEETSGTGTHTAVIVNRKRLPGIIVYIRVRTNCNERYVSHHIIRS